MSETDYKQEDSQMLGNIILTAIMLGLMILSYQLYDNNSQLKLDHKQDLEAMAVKLEQSSEKQLSYKQRLLLVSHPSTDKILLQGTDNSKDSYATVMYNPELKKILLDPAGMVDPLEGMAFQLWGKVNGQYIDMGVINQDQDLVALDTFVADIKSFIITLQLEGGDNEPDLDYIYVEGKL